MLLSHTGASVPYGGRDANPIPRSRVFIDGLCLPLSLVGGILVFLESVGCKLEDLALPQVWRAGQIWRWLRNQTRCQIRSGTNTWWPSVYCALFLSLEFSLRTVEGDACISANAYQNLWTPIHGRKKAEKIPSCAPWPHGSWKRKFFSYCTGSCLLFPL